MTFRLRPLSLAEWLRGSGPHPLLLAVMCILAVVPLLRWGWGQGALGANANSFAQGENFQPYLRSHQCCVP